MKRKLIWGTCIVTIFTGLFFIFDQANDISQQRLYEEKRNEVTQMLRDDLDKFNPTLAAFVDDNYKSTFGSAISSDGIVTFERKLAKNQEIFGSYVVKYDLDNMEVMTVELSLSNGRHADEWREFSEHN